MTEPGTVAPWTLSPMEWGADVAPIDVLARWAFAYNTETMDEAVSAGAGLWRTLQGAGFAIVPIVSASATHEHSIADVVGAWLDKWASMIGDKVGGWGGPVSTLDGAAGLIDSLRHAGFQIERRAPGYLGAQAQEFLQGQMVAAGIDQANAALGAEFAIKVLRAGGFEFLRPNPPEPYALVAAAGDPLPGKASLQASGQVLHPDGTID